MASDKVEKDGQGEGGEGWVGKKWRRVDREKVEQGGQ